MFTSHVQLETHTQTFLNPINAKSSKEWYSIPKIMDWAITSYCPSKSLHVSFGTSGAYWEVNPLFNTSQNVASQGCADSSRRCCFVLFFVLHLSFFFFFF